MKLVSSAPYQKPPHVPVAALPLNPRTSVLTPRQNSLVNARNPTASTRFRASAVGLRAVLQDFQKSLDSAVRKTVRDKWKSAHRTRYHVRSVREFGTTKWAFERVMPIAAATVHGCETPFQCAQRTKGVSTSPVIEFVWGRPGRHNLSSDSGNTGIIEGTYMIS